MPPSCTNRFMERRFIALALLPLLLAGCAAHFTNLTPQSVRRNETNLYPVEVAFTSRQQSLIWDTIQPSVVVESQSYPLRRVELMSNRWEGLVPVPPSSNCLHYKFKFDYLYNTIPNRKADSASSPTYTLQILNQP